MREKNFNFLFHNCFLRRGLSLRGLLQSIIKNKMKLARPLQRKGWNEGFLGAGFLPAGECFVENFSKDGRLLFRKGRREKVLVG